MNNNNRSKKTASIAETTATQSTDELSLNSIHAETFLREKAKEILLNKVPQATVAFEEMSLEETRKMLYELQVYKIELEIQNEELRRAQSDLQISQDCYSDFYHHAPVDFVTISERGLILDANLTIASLLGLARSDLYNQAITNLVFKEDQDIYYLHSNKFFKTGEPQKCDLRMVIKDETQLWVRLNFIAAHSSEGTPVCRIMLRDITKWKWAEEKLRETEASKREQELLRVSEARFREVLEHSLDASYKRNIQNETYEYLSPVFARITGYTPVELMMMPFEIVLDLVHLDDLPEVERALADSMLNLANSTYQLEYRFKHKGGQYRWLHDRFTVLRDADGHPIARIGSVSDISDRKLAEEKQRETLQEQETILNTANVGITLIIDRKQLWVNQKMVDLFQYTKKEMAGRSIRKLYPTLEAYEKSGRMAYPVIASGHVYEIEQTLIRCDGTPIWVKCIGKAVEPNDLSRGTIWIVEDIADRKRDEEALRESQSSILSILNSLSSEIAVMDSDGIITMVNDSWRRFALENSLEPGKIPLHAEIGSNYLTVCRSSDDSGADAYRGIQSVLEGRLTNFSMEYSCSSPKENRWFIMNVTSLCKDRSHGAVVAHTDITERKKIEEAILETESRYHRVFENQMISICIFDPETSQIIEVNNSLVQLYEYSREELLGMKLPDLSAEPEVAAESIQNKKAFSTPLSYQRKKDGTVFPIEMVGETFMRYGRLVTLVMLQDISQRKHTEEALLKAHEELEWKVLERTADLAKTNATLAMMLDYARKTESDIQERVVSNLRSNIMNIVDLMKKQPLTKIIQDLIQTLETTTQNLAHPLARNLESQLLKLTSREMQLANFIRLGKSTKELMDLLNLSANTIGTHRNNLRKKLGLSNKKINLRTYLNTQFVE